MCHRREAAGPAGSPCRPQWVSADPYAPVGAVLAARARSPYGARELRRQVDRAVEQALANQIASGTAHTGQHWTADCTVDGAIVLEEGEVVEQTIG